METTNKLIAEFIGAEEVCTGMYRFLEHEYLKRIPYSYEAEEVYVFEPNEMKFASSWKWLMPVVEKIRFLNADDAVVPVVENVNINIGVDCDIEVYMDRSIQFHTEYSTSSIEMVYKAVVEFIQWYNEQEK